MGGVRFIKWAQNLVSFVKCEPPSILLYDGDKRYNAFKDVLAPSLLSFVVKKALSLQGQTTFQRLACWVL